MVTTPLTFTYDQLLAMRLFEQYVTIACVCNQVGDNLVGNAQWTGVRLEDVLKRPACNPVRRRSSGVPWTASRWGSQPNGRWRPGASR